MAALVRMRIELEVLGSDGVRVITRDREWRWSPGVGNGKQETVTLTGSAFTALTVPTGSKAVLIFPADGAVSLTLKGVTGDGTGISIVPASVPINGPLFLTLGTTPSIGILNGGATSSAEILWL